MSGREYCQICGDEHGSAYDCSDDVERKERWRAEEQRRYVIDTHRTLARKLEPCKHCHPETGNHRIVSGGECVYCPICGRKL